MPNIPTDIPTVVFAIFSMEQQAEASAWCAKHGGDYLIAGPSLVIVGDKPHAWFHGTSCSHAGRQVKVQQEMQRSLGLVPPPERRVVGLETSLPRLGQR